MKISTQIFCCILSLLLFTNKTFSQEAGETRSVASGNWTDAAVWEYYSTGDNMWHPGMGGGPVTVSPNDTITITSQVYANRVISISAGGELNVSSSGYLNLTTIDSVSLRNDGTVIVQGTLASGNVIVNNSDFRLVTNSPYYSISARFNNYGTVTKTGTEEITFLQPFQNFSTVAVQEGTFTVGTSSGSVNSFTNAGSLQLSAGALFSIPYGATFIVQPGASLSGTGIFSYMGGGRILLNNDFVSDAGVTVNFGNTSSSTADTITGTGKLFVSGTFNWGSGRIEAHTTIALAGTMNVNGNVSLKDSLINNGQLNIPGSIQPTDSGAVILNAANLTLSGTGSIQSSPSSYLTLVNNAFITKSGNGISQIRSDLQNSSTVFLDSGTLELYGNTISYYAFYFSNAATLNNRGTFDANSGSFFSGTGTFNNYATLLVSYPFAIPAGIKYVQKFGNTSGTDSLSIAGTFEWQDNAVNVPVTIVGGGRLFLTDNSSTFTNTHTLNSSITNNGTIDWGNALLTMNNASIINNDSINITISTFPYTHSITGSGTNTVINNGLITQSSQQHTMSFGVPVTNNSSGKITGNGSYQFGSTLSNAGYISPGITTGTLSVNGAEPFSSTSTLGIQIVNTTSGNYDKLMRSGNLTLAGALVVTDMSSAPNGTYTIISVSGGSITGNFNSMTLPPFYSYYQTNTAVTVTKNYIASNADDYFRTSGNSGLWSDVASWESSVDSLTWHPATRIPDSAARSIAIRGYMFYDVDSTIDHAIVAAGQTFKVTSGHTLKIKNNGLTLKSDAAGTANLISYGTVEGTFNVENYQTARRAWRLITASVTNGNTIRQSWQNNGIYEAGKGTFITAPGGTNGTDNGNGYSLKTYNVFTQQLANVNNTNVPISGNTGNADNKGYFLFVRGDRDPSNLTPPNTNETVLTATGAMQNGPQTFGVSSVDNNFTLIGNPYPAQISFDNVVRSNVVKRFYVWDPSLNTVGGYVLVDDADGDGTYTVVPNTGQTQVINSGQAFFVQTNTDNSSNPYQLQFTSSSYYGRPAGSGKSNSTTVAAFKTTLLAKDAANAYVTADAVLAQYDNSYSAAVNVQDAPKMNNFTENLAIERGGQLLSIERRPVITADDTLFLKLWNTSIRDYQLVLTATDLSQGLSAWLEDSYLHTTTLIDLAAGTTVNFSVTSNAASADPYRFRIVFKPSATLDVSFTSVKAAQRGSTIEVNWKLCAESSMDHYVVEKMTNENKLAPKAELKATGYTCDAGYSWIDNNPVKGNNVYRIKAIAKSGIEIYSNLVVVRIASGKENIEVYPNPVKGKTITVQFTDKPGGKYSYKIISTAGQEIGAGVLQHDGGSATKTITLPSAIAKGEYQLSISNKDDRSVINLIAE